MQDNENLVKAYQNGDNTALNELIINNEGIVRKICNKYYGINKSLEFDDLLQEGRLGLIEAAGKFRFDIENRASFITFGIYYIDRFIHDAVNGQTSKEKENNELNNNAVSIYEPLKDMNGKELIDTIGNEKSVYELVEYKVYMQQLHRELNVLMQNELSMKQKEVLQFRYGFNGQRRATLKELGDIMDIPAENVRRTENKALRQLRRAKWTVTYGREYYKELFGRIPLNTYGR